MEFKHISVLLNETIDGLKIKPNGIYIDCTLGGGGHSLEIAKRLKNGRLICIDQDIEAIEAAKIKLSDFIENITFVKSNFKYFCEILDELKIDKVDGILMDIGVSSYQIDKDERGFSYIHNSELDMRMDQSQELTAKYIVNNYSSKELTDIFYKYGEEKWSKRIADFIVEKRKDKEIRTTFDLVEIIDSAVPVDVRRRSKGHYSKRVFQALRIEVNNELGVLEEVLPKMIDYLNFGGRLCIITFHSLEDRIVKNIFKDLNTSCICPPEIPICVCNKKKKIKIITRKPIVPSEEEIEQNPRSKSAKLRIVERVRD
ncbi:16S rRNA (cytosine(1402)-N(4))-methyltransferase RsmH [Miniphocaeibacter halophilus]|uniref:16S rRNA (Cytosine(1402)-N(4))-methyltransferase RsmH n=1 Tax=Miniphocaeibacter halophilus TaxID=2931922 RepID=A0AC61MPK7_9FIRM|nr:16S rRNA (cytosine(1402)-N(4))-methyltransferase RsmH [Miniphocaeibacter halophilus]QQK07505.1 16S rRNA (cytosine(1402)-N(4))-methyltransferase RsmH [Miniphocaeibacter halophilus]